MKDEYDRLPWEPPEEDDEVVWEVCPTCEVQGIVKQAKLVCPTCSAILARYDGD